MERSEPSYTVGRNTRWYSHYGEQDGDSNIPSPHMMYNPLGLTESVNAPKVLCLPSL